MLLLLGRLAGFAIDAHAQALSGPFTAPSASSTSDDTAVDRIIAIVNNDVITQRELDNRVQMIQQRMAQTQGSLPPLDQLRKQLLDQMVLDRIQLQRAKEDGITVDDGDIDATVQRLAQSNSVTVPQYRAAIEGKGVPWATFRRDVRDELLLTQVRQQEVDRKVTVSDAEVANYLASQAHATDDKSGGATGNVQQTHALHILLRVDDPSAEASVHQRIVDLKQKLDQGADFGTLARTYSQDGSKTAGGDLGWISPGETVADFERAMNALQPGQVSEPVRTQFGYHIIKVLERREVKETPAQRQDNARQALGARKAEQAYDDWLRQLRDSAYVEYKLNPAQS